MQPSPCRAGRAPQYNGDLGRLELLPGPQAQEFSVRLAELVQGCRHDIARRDCLERLTTRVRFITVQRSDSGQASAQPTAPTLCPNDMRHHVRRSRVEPGQGRFGHHVPAAPSRGEHLDHNILSVLSRVEPASCVGQHRSGVPAEEVGQPVVIALGVLAHNHMFPKPPRALQVAREVVDKQGAAHDFNSRSSLRALGCWHVSPHDEICHAPVRRGVPPAT